MAFAVQTCGHVERLRTLRALEGAAADVGVARVFVAAQALAVGFVERGQQVEGDVGGLIVGRVGAGDVVAERAERGLARQGRAELAGGKLGGERPAIRPVAIDST